jgi:hypothetical protein
MQVTIENGFLTIKVPVNKPLVPSKSGKTLLVASSGGNVTTTAMVEGRPVVVGLNAYIGK